MVSKLVEIKHGVYATERAAGVLGKAVTSKRASSKIIRKVAGATLPIEEKVEEPKQPSEYTEKEKEEYVQKNLLVGKSTLDPRTQFELGTGQLKLYRKTSQGLRQVEPVTYKGALMTSATARRLFPEQRTQAQIEIQEGRLKTYRRQPSGELVETTKEVGITREGAILTSQVIKSTEPTKAVPKEVAKLTITALPSSGLGMVYTKSIEKFKIPAYKVVKDSKYFSPEYKTEFKPVDRKGGGYGARPIGMTTKETVLGFPGRVTAKAGEKIYGFAEVVDVESTKFFAPIEEKISKHIVSSQFSPTGEPDPVMKGFVGSWVRIPRYVLNTLPLKAIKLTGGLMQVGNKEGREAIGTEFTRATREIPSYYKDVGLSILPIHGWSEKTGSALLADLMIVGSLVGQGQTQIKFGRTEIPQYASKTVTIGQAPAKVPTYGFQVESISTVTGYQYSPMIGGGTMTILEQQTPFFYEGLYLQRAVKSQVKGTAVTTKSLQAEPIFGYSSEGWKFGMPVFKGKISPSSIGTTELRYLPQSTLDVAITQQKVAMTTQEMMRLQTQTQLVSLSKGITPKTIQKQFYRESKYMAPEEVDVVIKELQNIKGVRVYGSTGAYAQMPGAEIGQLPITVISKSSKGWTELFPMAPPSDIDVMLSKMKATQIPGFAEKMASSIRAVGKTPAQNIRVTGTLVEKYSGGEWHHILDIHTKDMGLIEGGDFAYGVQLSKLGRDVRIENLKVMSQPETYARESVASGLSIGEGGFMPQLHRLKDIPKGYLHYKYSITTGLTPSRQAAAGSLLETVKGTYEPGFFEGLLKEQMRSPAKELILSTETPSSIAISSRIASQSVSVAALAKAYELTPYIAPTGRPSKGVSSKPFGVPSWSLISPIPSRSIVSLSPSVISSPPSKPSSISPSITVSSVSASPLSKSAYPSISSLSASISTPLSSLASTSRSASSSIKISSISAIPSSPSSFLAPSPSTSFTPGFGFIPPVGWLFGGGESKRRQAAPISKKRKRKTKYQPTITAYALGIFGKAKKGKLTGFEQRPIPTSWRKAIGGFT